MSLSDSRHSDRLTQARTPQYSGKSPFPCKQGHTEMNGSLRRRCVSGPAGEGCRRATSMLVSDLVTEFRDLERVTVGNSMSSFLSFQHLVSAIVRGSEIKHLAVKSHLYGRLGSVTGRGRGGTEGQLVRGRCPDLVLSEPRDSEASKVPGKLLGDLEKRPPPNPAAQGGARAGSLLFLGKGIVNHHNQE